MTLPDRILNYITASDGSIDADSIEHTLAIRFDVSPVEIRGAMSVLRQNNLVHSNDKHATLTSLLQVEDKPSLPDQVVAWLEVRGGELSNDRGRCAEIIATDLGVPTDKVARIFRDLAHAGRLTKRSKTRIGTLFVALRQEERSTVDKKKEVAPASRRNGSLVPYSPEFQRAVTAVVDIVEILQPLDEAGRNAVITAINERFYQQAAS